VVVAGLGGLLGAVGVDEELAAIDGGAEVGGLLLEAG
jgi:hypothetical protein